MVSVTPRMFVATCLVVAVAIATTPSFAAPSTASLSGTVYAGDVTTPLAGATVVLTDAHGATISSEPTRADGAFTIAAVTPGRSALSLQTAAGSFAVATPLTLAPGETRGIRLALKASSGTTQAKHHDTAGGEAWSNGAKGGMAAVILGFAAAVVVGVERRNNETPAAASASQPTDK